MNRVYMSVIEIILFKSGKPNSAGCFVERMSGGGGSTGRAKATSFSNSPVKIRFCSRCNREEPLISKLR